MLDTCLLRRPFEGDERMSEARHIPFSETKAPESADRLHRGALRLIDISASTMANIGPAYSFMFGFGLLVITAGIAAPLTISRSSPGRTRAPAASSRSSARRSAAPAR